MVVHSGSDCISGLQQEELLMTRNVPSILKEEVLYANINLSMLIALNAKQCKQYTHPQH